MKDFKDIGSLFEERLQGARVTADAQIWNRIEASMERKKRLFWLWTAGLGVIILGVGIWLSAEKSTSGVQALIAANTLHSEGITSISTESTAAPYRTPRARAIALIFQQKSKTTAQSSNIAQTVTEKKGTEKVSEASTTIRKNLADEETAAIKNPEDNVRSVSNMTRGSEVDDTKDTRDLEGFKKKTIYHYYNSATDSFYSTTNRRELDSITKANTPGTIMLKDSIAP